MVKTAIASQFTKYLFIGGIACIGIMLYADLSPSISASNLTLGEKILGTIEKNSVKTPLSVEKNVPHGPASEKDVVTHLSGTAPFKITFDMAATPETDKQYHWKFGDGTLAEGAVTVHTYTEPGSYLATLRIMVGNVVKSTNSFQITVIGSSAESVPEDHEATYKRKKVIKVSKIIYRGSAKQFLNKIETSSATISGSS